MIRSCFEISLSLYDGKYGYRLTDANGSILLSQTGFADIEQCRATLDLVRQMVCIPEQLRMENTPGNYRFVLYDRNNICIGSGVFYNTRKIRELKRIVMLLIISNSK